jgi:hypothetical protein
MLEQAVSSPNTAVGKSAIIAGAGPACLPPSRSDGRSARMIDHVFRNNLIEHVWIAGIDRVEPVACDIHQFGQNAASTVAEVTVIPS